MLGIIGGTGLYQLDCVENPTPHAIDTPWGPPEARLTRGDIGGHPVVFMPRHGEHHRVAPHRINYRANLRALADAGADRLIAVAAVGGVADEPLPGGIAIPDQLIDYTWGRPSTFFEGEGDGNAEGIGHIDFTQPYTESTRQQLLAAANRAEVPVHNGGCYAATQGPRLETAAEIHRLERDGCTLVGMTGMPEAALARELDIPYACCAVVVNPAAGKSDAPVDLDDIRRHLQQGMANAARILEILPSIDAA